MTITKWKNWEDMKVGRGVLGEYPGGERREELGVDMIKL